MTDQLERLFRALVLRVRDVRPENLSRPFEVGDILRAFVPYRATRAEVGVETAEDYEVLILRLLSGERGFLFADDGMQDDLRRELDSGNPDLQALQAYGTARVTLAQHAMRQVLEAAPAPAAATSATSLPAPAAASAEVSPAAPASALPTTGSTVLRDSEGRVVASLASAPPPVAPPPGAIPAALDALQRQLPPTLAELGEAIGAVVDPKMRAPYQSRASRIPDPTAETGSRTPRPGCRFCGQALPEARDVTFCPHCGQNLKVRRCPGCSAEMDPAWKFCVTCGRAANG
jgi:hypothetical protein